MKKSIFLLIVFLCFVSISTFAITIKSNLTDKDIYFSKLSNVEENTFSKYVNLNKNIQSQLTDEQNKILQSGKELYKEIKNYKELSDSDFQNFKVNYSQWKEAVVVADDVIAKEQKKFKPFALILAFIASISTLLIYFLNKYNKVKSKNNQFNNSHSSNMSNEQQAQWNQMNFWQQEQNRQFMEWSMNEARKAVTPFDHGGYVMGDGFNPSDTMAADMDRQAQEMNNINNMNNMNF